MGVGDACHCLDLRTHVVAAYRQPGARQITGAACFSMGTFFLKKLLCHERQAGYWLLLLP
jgi:hypothetical protein